MKSIKGIFGYSGSLGRSNSSLKSRWVDLGVWLIPGISSLEEENEGKQNRIIIGLTLLVLVVFGYRLFELQINQGNRNQVLAQGNRIRREVSVAPRGAIVDATGETLVTNSAQAQLVIVPADLPYKKADRDRILEMVSRDIGVAHSQLTDKVQKAGLFSHVPLILRPKLSQDEVILYKLKFIHTPAAQIVYTSSRQYDSTPGLSHILGYTSEMSQSDIKKHPDYHLQSPIGRAGLESSYDIVLRGEVGYKDIEVNSTGQYQRTVSTVAPKVGLTLNLSIIKELQAEMASALVEAMSKENVKQAVGVAMDPNTGALLASVSLPSYNNSLFAQGISVDDYTNISNDPQKPLLNRALDGLYPAGSTIKPFVAAAALEEGTITNQTLLDTSAGVIEIGESRFPDWKVHGITNVTRAIAESNDIFFYALGGGYKQIPPLGIDRLGKYFRLFGLGRDMGVDYASENVGLVPTPDWKRKVKKENWYIGDTYHVSIGQGDLLVTPTQMARALSSLVNGGRLITPHVVTKTQDLVTQEIKELNYPEQKIPISDKTIKIVREGMRQTVELETGSARSLQGLGFSSGGKTGTAQFGSGDNEKTHAWYIGYAPLDNPKIVVSVIVEGGGEGNAISVPVAGRVFQKYLK